MKGFDEFNIIPFSKEYQEETKKLILEGIKEYVGEININFNKDLNNIEEQYKDGKFLLAIHKEKLIGTGALIYNGEFGQIVRMSVDKNYRNLGIGKKLLDELIEHALKNNTKKIIVETTNNWKNAINFYKSYGFKFLHYKDDDIYFYLDIK
ncbi:MULTISPECIES: GNAT family N-acetyltransferase [unclassified Clostridium]|uniref:GNAT family N-acetyltransferase n=1 Tax=unclassified Clostridium TaxID=2614128 RepID=UPI0025BDE946|nr:MULTISPECIES: GNAT family N-acetyltransferase [unclassified Clostridium]